MMSLEHMFSEALLHPEKQEALEALFPAVDFAAAGMPPPGANFIKHANELSTSPEEIINLEELKKKKKLATASKALDYLYRRAMYDPTFSLPVMGKRGVFSALFVPGHIIGDLRSDDPIIYGPKPARIMLVGKMPGRDNLERRDAMAGRGLEILINTLHAVNVPPTEYAKWFTTFACKFAPPNADVDTIEAAWFKDCAPLMAQEFRLVKPDYILCLGADAVKAVLGSPVKLNGRVATVNVPTPDGSAHEIKVMSALHPAYVARKSDSATTAEFESQIQRFVALTNNVLITKEVVDHAEIYTKEALAETVDAMLADPDPNANIIAIDCEWHGDYPTEHGAYLRTIQISNKDKWARTVVLRYEGGATAFRPNLDAARTQLTRLLKSTSSRCVRVGGHFLRADLPWLIDFGVDVRDEYAPDPDVNNRAAGGWDTSLLYHAYNETAKYALDDCVMRFTSAPTYWEKLYSWKKKFCAQNKIKPDALGGYGECPSHVLHPYANYDVDVTRRIMMYFYGTNGYDGKIASDANGNDCWLPYWTAHMASLAFLEMEMTGLVIDRDRTDALATLFMEQQAKLLSDVRNELRWPDFNPKSHPQLAVALFGKSFVGNFANKITIPNDAALLDLTPIKTTGKRPRLWHTLDSASRRKLPPSTDKESLGILGHANNTAAKIRDYKFIAQVLQSVLRVPNVNNDGDFETDDNGNYVYEKGLVGSAHSDGKVRTHLFQTKETGRASSSRPPLQNLSKRRESDYERILGAAYSHPVRSVLKVPEGCVGIETDLTGAELAVLAWLSQDHNMIDHVRRNNLPSSHPDHYDIHSQQAVKAFRLTGVHPTKKGLEKAGKIGLRVAAKNVNFGIPYGRGAEAIARQCKEEGVEVTQGECQAMIDAYFDSYPGTYEFLAECRARSQDPGWIVGPYGRMRRFIKPFNDDYAVVAEQERQAQNFPIQGGVADAVSLALANFYKYRKEHPEIKYDIALQIHDAIVLIVPVSHAKVVYHEVIPKCMIDDVPFWPRYLGGKPIPMCEPYYFGMDRDVFVHWGEKLQPAEVRDLGLEWLAEK
jgi:uracil-DNA glycosylase family 4